MYRFPHVMSFIYTKTVPLLCLEIGLLCTSPQIAFTPATDIVFNILEPLETPPPTPNYETTMSILIFSQASSMTRKCQEKS